MSDNRVKAYIVRGGKVHTNNFTKQMWDAMGRNKNGWIKGDPPKDINSASAKAGADEVNKTMDANSAKKLIEAGDALVKDGEFNAALTKYEQAATVKSTAALTKKIESAKFKGLVAEGDKAFDDGDFETALELYGRANDIKTVKALTKKIEDATTALENDGDGDGDGLV